MNKVQKQAIIDIATTDNKCSVIEISEVHWRVIGKKRSVEFYPTTGTVYANAHCDGVNDYDAINIKGKKESPFSYVASRMEKAAKIANEGQ